MVRGQGKRSGSLVKGHWSVVKGHRSEVRVTGQSRVTGQRSLVSGQGSLVKPFSIIRPYTNPIQPKVWK